MMKAELSEAIGEKHAGIPAQERVGSGRANSKGSVVFGGRHVSIERPRGRRSSGEEIGPDNPRSGFSSADLLNSLVLERIARWPSGATLT